MDLRKYFGGGTLSSSSKTQPAPKSALSAIKSKAAPTKDVKSPRKRSPKAVPTIDLDAEDSDESPLPSSLKDKKRQRVVIASDSDDDIPVVKRKIPTKEKAVSPQKSPVRKRSRVITSESPSPAKEKTKNKKKEISPIKEESDEDEVMITDSEDEFVEKKSSKKNALLKGQKKLTFASQDKKIEPVVPKKPAGKVIDPSSFFGGPAKNTIVKEKEKEKVREEKSVLSLKNQKVVAPKKVKTPEKKKERDEFSEDSFDDSPKKKSPVKKASKKDRDEFSEDSFDDSPKKKTPVKRAKKEMKKESPPLAPIPKKAHSDKSKESPKIPIPGKNVSKSQPVVVQREVKKEEKEVFVPWVDKYKPQSLQQLVGQHGDRSPMNKLTAWLNGWKTWHLGEGAKVARRKPPPGMETDGSPFKAILLSGPPGIGKTTCAHLACKLAGFKVVEMNASDVRNKKHLEAHVAQLTGSHQLDEYFGRNAKDTHNDNEVHHVLIMDEVDGMSGNEDRGGVSELVDIIEDSKIPIICICNDRSIPKMRTLANHAYDIRFPKPRAEMFISRVMTICAQEKMKITKEEALEIIEQSGQDVRQTIYNLQLRKIGGGGKTEQKDYTINSFEAARRLLGQSATLADRQQMFFVDYSIMPLFVQDNYPRMKGTDRSKKDRNELANLRKAADLLAWGDTIEKTIRTSGSWKLLNEQSILSAALPTMAMDGQIKQMINFPIWLGKNSNAGKRQRMLRQIEYHANLQISASPTSLVMDYLPVMREKLTKPLIEKEKDGVMEVIDMMNAYHLLKDDVDAIAELAQWPGRKDPYALIPSTVKAALTRTLNKTVRSLPYVVEEVSKGRKKAADTVADLEVNEAGVLVERSNDDDGLEDDDEEEEKEIEKKAPAKTTTSTRGRGGGARGGRGRGRGK